MDRTFTEFLAKYGQNDTKITISLTREDELRLEILKFQFELVARIHTSSQAVLVLLQRTRLIAALTLAGRLDITRKQIGSSLVYLSSLLAFKHREIGLTKDNMCQLVKLG